MKTAFFAICLIGTSYFQDIHAQNFQRRPLNELIDSNKAGLKQLSKMIASAKNHVQIIPKNESQADSCLFKLQVTTKSTLGTVAYETGGIMVDNGWIRILGSGSPRMNRNIVTWNSDKAVNNDRILGFLLIADDVLGGFFAINNGTFGNDGTGKVFYFAPETFRWENTNLNYTEFLSFCFNNNLEDYYKGLRWDGWRSETSKLRGDQAYFVFPYLCTKEGADIKKDSKDIVDIQTLWISEMNVAKSIAK